MYTCAVFTQGNTYTASKTSSSCCPHCVLFPHHTGYTRSLYTLNFMSQIVKRIYIISMFLFIEHHKTMYWCIKQTLRSWIFLFCFHFVWNQSELASFYLWWWVSDVLQNVWHWVGLFFYDTFLLKNTCQHNLCRLKFLSMSRQDILQVTTALFYMFHWGFDEHCQPRIFCSCAMTY